MNLGILGGSFDPIHHGHLLLAETAWRDLSLERLIFIPAHRSPWKLESGATPAERFEMVRLAIQNRRGFEYSRIELERKPPSYTVDTLRTIKRENPEDNLWLILGADGIADLPFWHESPEIFKLARIAVGHRPGEDVRIPEELRYLKDRIQILNGPECTISSTEIRKRIRAGESIADFLPAEVSEYIHKNGIYR